MWSDALDKPICVVLDEHGIGSSYSDDAGVCHRHGDVRILRPVGAIAPIELRGNYGKQ
ncbi:hypothetical protein HNP40_003958 [Mycobacteroides chelonae]|nr:hypothetical protein [Mycobacteroides chelonae]